MTYKKWITRGELLAAWLSQQGRQQVPLPPPLPLPLPQLLLLQQQQQPFNGHLSGTTRIGWYQKKHSPTHTHPDHRTSYYDPQHPRCSVYVLDSPLVQPLSRSSLVFLLVLDPLLHTPCISSPNHHVFAAHAHTNAASSAVRTKVQDITQQR